MIEKSNQKFNLILILQKLGHQMFDKLSIEDAIKEQSKIIISTSINEFIDLEPHINIIIGKPMEYISGNALRNKMSKE